MVTLAVEGIETNVIYKHETIENRLHCPMTSVPQTLTDKRIINIYCKVSAEKNILNLFMVIILYYTSVASKCLKLCVI